MLFHHMHDIRQSVRVFFTFTVKRMSIIVFCEGNGFDDKMDLLNIQYSGAL